MMATYHQSPGKRNIARNNTSRCLFFFPPLKHTTLTALVQYSAISTIPPHFSIFTFLHRLRNIQKSIIINGLSIIVRTTIATFHFAPWFIVIKCCRTLHICIFVSIYIYIFMCPHITIYNIDSLSCISANIPFENCDTLNSVDVNPKW